MGHGCPRVLRAFLLTLAVVDDLLATFLLVKFTAANLDPKVRWLDLVAVSVVAGIGFTVSLLISELSFGKGSPHSEHVKAAILGGALLTWRSRAHARIHDLTAQDVSVEPED